LRPINGNLTYSRQDADAFPHLSIGEVIQLTLCGRITDQRDVLDGLIVWVRFRERRRTGKIDWQSTRRALDGSLHIGRGVGDAFAEHEL